MMKLTFVFLGLSCLLMGIYAAPAADKENLATLQRLLRLLIDEEKKEAEMERKQVSYTMTDDVSITLYLQRDVSDLQNPKYRITWNPPSNKPDGTTVGTAETTWNADPNHKFRITDLQPDTTYTIEVCREKSGMTELVCNWEKQHKTKAR